MADVLHHGNHELISATAASKACPFWFGSTSKWRTHHVGGGERGPAGVGSGGTVGGGLAEVRLRTVALAVLLQVACHILARQAGRDGPHVVQDLGRDSLVSSQRLYCAHKAVVQLLRPLHLHPERRFQKFSNAGARKEKCDAAFLPVVISKRRCE